jgi:hypothetical protein
MQFCGLFLYFTKEQLLLNGDVLKAFHFTSGTKAGLTPVKLCKVLTPFRLLCLLQLILTLLL